MKIQISLFFPLPVLELWSSYALSLPSLTPFPSLIRIVQLPCGRLQVLARGSPLIPLGSLSYLHHSPPLDTEQHVCVKWNGRKADWVERQKPSGVLINETDELSQMLDLRCPEKPLSSLFAHGESVLFHLPSRFQS